MDSSNNPIKRWDEIAPALHALQAVDNFTVDIMLSEDESYFIVTFYEQEFLQLPMEERTKAGELVAAVRNVIAEHGLPVTTLMAAGMP